VRVAVTWIVSATVGVAGGAASCARATGDIEKPRTVANARDDTDPRRVETDMEQSSWLHERR
jgi:hypothetical protein